MTIEEFLFQAGSRLRDGDYLLADAVVPAIEAFRADLERRVEQVEDDPSPTGLEALDTATLEAFSSFLDALDLLELATLENLPQLGTEILSVLQDAVETTREVRRVAETHHSHIQEEIGWQA